jgi:dethiobiotin synthetase
VTARTKGRSTRSPARASGIFVAGTDTGVGKTLISCGLLRLAQERGWPLVPFKPAESGCVAGRPQDAAALRDASGRRDLALSRICPFAFRPAVAPAAAAHAAGRVLTVTALRRAGRLLAAAAGGPLLVESAGGLLSPYAPTFTAADLALEFGLGMLLIARNALGTINHTALALAEIRRRRIPLLGLLLVTTRPARALAQQQNPALIEALTGVRPEATIPYFKQATTERIAAHLARSGVGELLLRRAGIG